VITVARLLVHRLPQKVVDIFARKLSGRITHLGQR